MNAIIIYKYIGEEETEGGKRYGLIEEFRENAII